MRFLKNITAFFVLLVTTYTGVAYADNGGSNNQSSDNRPNGSFVNTATEALSGFDNIPNGLIDQATFDAAKLLFEKRRTIAEGLGPFYNAESCSDCHQNPVTGSASQVNVLRAGSFNDGVFTPPPGGGSLVPDRSIDANLQAHVDSTLNVRTLRMSTNALGDGYVEAIADQTLLDIAASQAATKGRIKGQAIWVPILEAFGTSRVGRFGWKNQHASLLSFAGDASRNELGITNGLVATEATPMGVDGSQFDRVADPEDTDNRTIISLANFMRATKAPEPDFDLANSQHAIAGKALFDNVGCDSCHVESITTAPTGTVLSPAFTVPQALGNKTIHPYSDFLLHDVGTNDGIVQNGGAATRNKVRTAPLWGLRTHARLLHDGRALTLDEAIRAHSVEAVDVIKTYIKLDKEEKDNLITFLNSI